MQTGLTLQEFYCCQRLSYAKNQRNILDNIFLFQNKYSSRKQVHFQRMLEVFNVQNAQIKVELIVQLWLSDIRNAGRDLDFLMTSKATAGKQIYLRQAHRHFFSPTPSTLLRTHLCVCIYMYLQIFMSAYIQKKPHLSPSYPDLKNYNIQ